jgi:hypothetical protein
MTTLPLDFPPLRAEAERLAREAHEEARALLAGLGEGA